MKTQFPTKRHHQLGAGVLFAGMTASAETRYVWQDSPSPTPPHTTWATRRTTSRRRVDAAEPGDTVPGDQRRVCHARAAVSGSLTNRVAIDKPHHGAKCHGAPSHADCRQRRPRRDQWRRRHPLCLCRLQRGLERIQLSPMAIRGPAATGTKNNAAGGAWCEISGVISNCTLTGLRHTRAAGWLLARSTTAP